MRTWIALAALLGGCGINDTGGGSGSTKGFARGIGYNSSGDIWVADQSDFQNDVTKLTTDGSNSSPALTRDGSRVAYVHGDAAGSASTVFAVPSAGGSATALIPSGAHSFGGLAWSPDGQTLYAAMDGTIVSVAGSGSGLGQVGPAGNFSSPSVASDGTVFALDGNGNFARVANGAASAGFSAPNAMRGAVSPDGSRIAYEDGSAHEIFVVDSSGAPRQVTSISGGEQSDPCWSSDGTQLFFSSTAGGAEKIYSVDASASMSSGSLVQVGSQPSFGG